MEEAVGLVWSEWAAVLGGLVTPPISRGVKVLSELITVPPPFKACWRSRVPICVRKIK